MMKTADKLIHDVDRSDCRQKVLKVDRKTQYLLPHLLLPDQRPYRAFDLKIPGWEPARYPVTNNSH